MSSAKPPARTPRLFKNAKIIAKAVKEDGASLKELVYSNKYKHYNIKSLYVLALRSLQNEEVVDRLIERSGILEKEKAVESTDPWLVRVLMTQLLWGSTQLSPVTSCIESLLKYEKKFKELLKEEEQIGNFAQQLQPPKEKKPRYVRVNTMAMSVEEAVKIFQDDGWQLLKRETESYEKFLQTVADLKEDEFIQDIHIPELLVFHHKTEFHENELYTDGCIIVQDKASLLPVYLLKPESNSTVLDMCAAPGNKTTHIAAVMNNTGTVYAVEMNKRRYETLCSMVRKSGTTCVKTINADVLTVDSAQCPDVKYILLDPSCSGSGMVGRVKMAFDGDNHNRLERLAGFQIKLLRHALNSFPDVECVVYSTCSLHCEENEEVVERVLEDINRHSDSPKFRLVGNLLPNTWINRGSTDYKHGPQCLYARPQTDLTNGFFVAVFERVHKSRKRKHKKSTSCDVTNEEAVESESTETFPSDNAELITDDHSHVQKTKKCKKKKQKLDTD